MKSKLTLLSAMVFLFAMVFFTSTGFADEGNSVPPSASSFPLPNTKPNISVSDTNVLLLSSSDSVKISLLVSDPDGDRIKVEKISGLGTFSPKDQPAPVSTIFFFHPDSAGIYSFIFRATDEHGAMDQDTVLFTVAYNLPPQLTCPNTQSHHINGNYTVSQVVADDFDGTITDISAYLTGAGVANLTLTNIQGIGTSHVTANFNYDVTDHCAAGGFVYVIGTDNSGAKDTCYFGINLFNNAPTLTCPSNGSVHSGATFVSADFTTSDPDNDVPVVSYLSITPCDGNNPTIVGNHVEWVTTCTEKGDYVIRLLATDPCGYTATCEFTVHVYNQPPVLTCPNNGSVHAGQRFTSSDFSCTDPEGDPVTISFFDITPPATSNPYQVNNHIEWLTTCAEKGTYTIRLLTTDSCGAKDTCEFTVNVSNQPPVLTCPNNGSVHAGQRFTSSDFSYTDPESDPVTVSFLSITPPAANTPFKLSNHIVWFTTCEEKGTYTIRLLATDNCGAKDTCEFTVNVYNQPPVLICPANDSINAGDNFVSNDYSISDPDDSTGVTVSIESISPTPTYAPVIVGKHVEWRTGCKDLIQGPTYTITLIAADPCGAEDTCQFTVTVYNLPPEITCPEDDSSHAGSNFVSTDFSTSDPKSEPVTVSLCGITPSPVNQPGIIQNHIEWQTACGDAGKIFTICLVAEDGCRAKDTCYFDVTVYNQPPQLTCPANDSIHAGNTFTSTDFSVTDPDGDITPVTFLSITPSATNNPTIAGSHVEWITTCAENGDYTIKLLATDPCGLKDTCEFTVNVYNQPPVLTCPDDGIINAPQTFISTDFSVTDADGDNAPVTFLDITPTATNNPTIVGNHVEWVTTYAEYGEYIIRLVATDPCGLKDTCQFKVMVFNEHTGEFTCPDDDSVHAGVMFISTNYTVSGPGANPDSVRIISITPAPVNQPIKVEYHVEWQTECGDAGKVFTICLEAKDDYGDYDTCCFYVTVYNRPPQLTCPENGSVHSGEMFTSTDFSATDPDGDTAPVTLLEIHPSTTNSPIIVGNHVEWNTTCDDSGEYTVSLVATDPCGLKDTCEFMVDVYNQPPDLTCPDSDSIEAGDEFISTNFSVTDPEGDSVTVNLCGISPSPVNQPSLVQHHLEWQTASADSGKAFTICLVAEDSCGAKDTCYFNVTVYNPPPQLVLDLDSTDVFCHGGSDGTITATWIGGTSPFTINIDSGGFVSATSPYVFYNLPAGSHQVVVKDARDYADTTNIIITQPPELSCTVSPGDTLICSGDSAHFCVFPAGGTPPYSYLWEGPHAFTSAESCMFAHDAGTYSVKVTDAHACTTRCDGILTTQSCAQEYCGLTQGAYGNGDGNYFGMSALQLIQSLLSSSPVVVGKPGRSITIPYAAAECIIKRLPGGSGANTLPVIGNDTLSWDACQTSPPLPVFTGGSEPGRFKNGLLTQTITLSLNVRLPCDVGSFVLCEETHTKKADYGDDNTPCTGDDGIEPGSDSITVRIPQPVLTALSNLHLSPDVNGLLELANRALAGWSTGGASLSQINCAVDAINRGFDECRFVTYCGPLIPDISLNDEAVSMPSGFSLNQNQPNPFNPSCVIAYALPTDCKVRLVIYNLLGQKAKVLVDEHQDAGYKSVTWDGKDSQGQELPTGIYFYRIEAGSFVQSKKMLLMK